MKVAHIDTASTWRGGEKQVLSLAEGLRKAGHDVLVVCPPGSELERACRERLLETRAVPMRAELDLPAMARVAGALRRFGAEVVHCHTARAHTLGLAAAWLAGTPVTVVSRRVDFPVGGNVFSKLKYRLPVDAVVAVSSAVKEVLVASGLRRRKIAVVPGGVDPGKYRGGPGRRKIRAEMGLEDGTPVIGALGALVPHKGHSSLIKALPALRRSRPDLMCVIVGAGELERDLRDLSRDLGVESALEFVGHQSDVRSIVPAFDCLVHPSKLDASPNVLKEAMVMGVPVVATNVGGVSEIVVDGDCGLLVPPGDIEALAGAVGRVLDDDKLRRRLVAGGVARVEEFSVDRTVEETCRLYARLLKEKRGGLN
jgi:glycosyltransferase involved in cell wall biosynthesis